MKTSVSQVVPDTLGYDFSADRHDEVFDSEGNVRAHWSYPLESLIGLGQRELMQRSLKASRILRDDGATYTSLDSPNKSNTWELDPVPMLLNSDEWQELEVGLIERAELLDMLVKDLYGERRLVKEGILPPELVYGHKGFLRACYDVSVPGERQLIFHAADLIRQENGEVCILTDRTQVPRGVGYALENRNVMSRVFPSLFRDSQVHRLSMFFQGLRQRLKELAPAHAGAQPSVVLLTPGAFSQSYFEHTYLANYLGYPLVQGGDLTVRGGRVWMKSVGGLSPVDVILRFVDDAFCDPVELRSDSHLGVPGLLGAVRDGNVTVVNPLGVSALENPALLKYMSQISRFFLGREPRLKSVNTYWCADADDLAFVNENFDKMVLKTINQSPQSRSVFVAELTERERDEWRARLQRDPQKYVAQDYLEPSQSPTLVAGSLQPRRILMRSFSVASDQSYSVMPGSLSRIAPNKRSMRVAAGSGALSKDTWVLASEPEKQFSLRPRERRTPNENTQQSSLPSRVIENLFWMGRYCERSETTARLLRTVLMQLNSSTRLPKDAQQQMLTAVSDVTDTLPGFRGTDAAEMFLSPDKELLSVVLDGTRIGSLAHSSHAMLACAEEAKELLSSDALRIVNDIRDELNNIDQELGNGLPSAPEESLDPLVTGLLALVGQTRETMFRGLGWRFLEVGRCLEKAYQTSSLIRHLLVARHEEYSQDILVETLLISAEALISYRRRYLAEVEVDNALHLMMLDVQNPRSLLFLMKELETHLEVMSAQPQNGALLPEQKQLLSITTQLQLLEFEALLEVDADELVR
ncbi:MAG: circularly permuted type 2 ATP-grasp protein, partial [Pontibacterium sp.]